MDTELLKRRAAEQAVALVESGMLLGLGTGTTAGMFLDLLGERLKRGQVDRIRGVASSRATEIRARRLGISLCELEAGRTLDLAVDGADEIDANLDLIKGGGGALLREKIVAEASRRYVIVADETKLTPRLGAHRALPVEIVPFGWRWHRAFLRSLGGEAELRRTAGGAPFATDEGNFIVDCRFPEIASDLGERLKCHAGIVEHGLFVGYASEVIVAGATGVQHLRPRKD